MMFNRRTIATLALLACLATGTVQQAAAAAVPLPDMTSDELRNECSGPGESFEAGPGISSCLFADGALLVCQSSQPSGKRCTLIIDKSTPPSTGGKSQASRPGQVTAPSLSR